MLQNRHVVEAVDVIGRANRSYYRQAMVIYGSRNPVDGRRLLSLYDCGMVLGKFTMAFRPMSEGDYGPSFRILLEARH